MAPKRMRTFGSSSSTPFSSELFSSQEQEIHFNRGYAKRRILPSYHLKEKVFTSCSFLKWFEEASLRSFIYDILQEKFSRLMNMFYSNLKYVRGVLSSEVKRHPMRLSLEKLADASAQNSKLKVMVILICMLLIPSCLIIVVASLLLSR